AATAASLLPLPARRAVAGLVASSTGLPAAISSAVPSMIVRSWPIGGALSRVATYHQPKAPTSNSRIHSEAVAPGRDVSSAGSAGSLSVRGVLVVSVM